MFLLITGLLGLLVIAMISALAAYRFCKSDAWESAYNSHGMGLAIEMVFAILLFFGVLAVALIMRQAFDALYLSGGWRSPWYLGAAGTIGVGVLTYMNLFAPKILLREQKVDPSGLASQCRIPYLLYTPYSVIIYVILVLPMVAMVYTSIIIDHSTMTGALSTLSSKGALVASLLSNGAEFDANFLSYFQLEYQEAVAVVELIVNRYLWVVGTFMVFLIVMLNTKITTIFTEEAQDFFKWIMWLLLMVAMGICIYGLIRFHAMRTLALDSYTSVLTDLKVEGNLENMLATKDQIVTLQSEGAMSFLRKVLDGGGLWLLFFSYGSQIVLAKVTNRSVLDIVFPGNIAKFLGSFINMDEE